jgi:hypothetical protein
MSQDFYGEVARSIRRGTESIEYCRNLVERKIQEDKAALLLKRRDETVPEAAVGRLWHHLEITLANTFRYTLLSGVCAVAEECVDAIVDRLIPDEATRKKALRTAENEVRARKGRTNWLGSRIQLISSVTTLSLTPQFQTNMRQFADVISLRNCIGHAWGNVGNADYPEQVRAAVSCLEAEAKKANCDFASISQDGYLILGRDMLAHALCLAVETVDYLCGQMKANRPEGPSAGSLT